MKGKKEFTPKEAGVIIGLINKKVNANAQEQKTLRKRIRDLVFFASDFGIGGGYTKTDSLRLDVFFTDIS